MRFVETEITSTYCKLVLSVGDIIYAVMNGVHLGVVGYKFVFDQKQSLNNNI